MATPQPVDFPRSLLRFTDEVRSCGQLAAPVQWITRFPAPTAVRGYRLPVCWWNTGQQIFVRHARASVWRDGEWQVVHEDAALPDTAPHEVTWAEPVLGRAFRFEALSRSHPEEERLTMYAGAKEIVFMRQLGGGWPDAFRWLAEPAGEPVETRWAPPARAAFTPGTVGTAGAPGLRVTRVANALEFDNGWLRLGLSLERPCLRAFSWDSEQTGRQATDLLHQVTMAKKPRNRLHSGPVLDQPEHGVDARSLGCERVEASGDGVSYHGIDLAPGARLDARWRMARDHAELSLELDVASPLRAIQWEAWRWVFDLRTAVTGCLAKPAHALADGTRGRCAFPATWHAPNFGNLRVELVEGDPATTFVRVETWRQESLAWFGVELGVRPREDGDVDLLPGRHRAVLRFRRGRFEGGGGEHPALRRAWASHFGFRPEHYGLSNNAGATNCLFCVWQYADLAAATEPAESRVLALEMCRFTLDLALRGGAGYGWRREAFLDTASSLLIAAAVVDNGDADRRWLASVWSGLWSEAEFLLGRVDTTGLVVAPLLTGNRGECKWSSNWWDVVCFGHLDAYCNILAWRALRLAARLAARLGKTAEAERCRSAAEKLRAAFLPTFLNPATGWLGGWRSRDGELHDHAFLFVNGLAISFGLVEGAQARDILERLEARRVERGLDRFDYGLPGNLDAVPRDSVPAGHAGQRADGRDQYGFYENGGLTMSMAYGYVRALGKHGFAIAAEMEAQMLASFEAGRVLGGLHTGIDWRWWDGTPCGYEGLLVDQVQVLLAFAQSRGRAPELLTE